MIDVNLRLYDARERALLEPALQEIESYRKAKDTAYWEKLQKEVDEAADELEARVADAAARPEQLLTEEEVFAEPAPAAPTASVEDVRTALKAVVDAQGVPAAIALLGTFGVSNVNDLPEERRGEFVAAAKGAA